MKRLYTVLSLILLLAVLAMPAIARADDEVPPPPEQSQPVEAAPAPDGWTWDESSAPAAPDGWTWDE
jgi:hypothetical protein